MLEWLMQNKEWVFSGVGVALVIGAISWVFRRRSVHSETSSSGPSATQKADASEGSINVQVRGTTGDITIGRGMPDTPRSSDNAVARVNNRRKQSTVAITLSHPLRNTTLRFGLLYVRDGKDQVPDHGPLLNKELYFREIGDRGTLAIEVEHDSILGFQFKCFVDYRGYELDWVKNALEANGFREVTEGQGRAFRAWFLIPEHSVCETIDGIRNNFAYPA